MVKTSLFSCCKNSSVYLIAALMLSLPANCAEDIVKINPVDSMGENTYVTYTMKDGNLTPQYYQVTMDSEYGDKQNSNPDRVLYYKWDDSKGYNTLTGGSAEDYDIKYYMNNTLPELSEVLTNDGEGKDYSFNAENFNIKTPIITNNGSINNLVINAVKNTTGQTSPVYNYGHIQNIVGEFVGNKGGTWNRSAAITNTGTIDNISGVFINNISTFNNGVIANEGHIGKIEGIFINNAARDHAAVIGGLSATANIDSISGVFIGNVSNAHGMIWNNVVNDKIKGIFIGNKANNGAAIQGSHVHKIIGDFIGNHAAEHAGAIFASADYIEGNFINNSAGTTGGAVRASQYLNEEGLVMHANFIGNHATGLGGAFASEGGMIKEITGVFIRNYLENTTNPAEDMTMPEFHHTTFGGAIAYDKCNAGVIKKINADFIENYVKSVESPVYGGAIANYYDEGGIMEVIEGDFYRNHITATEATAHGGMYVGRGDAHLDSLTGNYIGNYASSDTKATGGAIYNEKSLIGSINGVFSGNYAESKNSNAYGGAIHNDNDGVIGGEFTDIYGKKQTGAITASFVNNYVKSESSDKFALGGAVFTSGDLTFAADNSDVVISGNYTEDSRGKINNGIWVRTNEAVLKADGSGYDYKQITPTVTFNAKNNGKVVINDTIDGGELSGKLTTGKFEKYEEADKITRENAYNLALKGDNSGRIFLNNDVINANLSLDNTNLYLSRESLLNESYLNLNSGLMSTINNQVGVLTPKSFTVTGDTNLVVDVDLANQKMDRIEASNYGSHTGNLVVSGMNLLSDTNKQNLEIYFAQKGLKDNVVNAVGVLPDGNQTVFTPIFKYHVDYDNRTDGGYFVFNRGNSASDYNPSVLATPAAAEAGGQSIINETVRFAFQHADTFSQMPFADRIAYINQNRYAITEGSPKYSANFEKLNKGIWVKPFTSFETITLNNGPDVDAITYGTLVGFDTNFKKLNHGWYNVQSGYIGYNGSQLSYKGVDTSLNGGLAGLTETFYKNNFFTALTATAGASVGTNNTMYGNEDYTMLLGGLGSKTGYNFEFKDGKYILQPIMFMNYSFVNTFDYTSASGIRMKNDPFHTLQINPLLKFTANLQNGWQPYASVGFVWNVLNCGKVRANNVVLPNMSVDPYVEYGLGIQKHWKDKFTGFAQAMVRNGGRNGVALTFGFRWALGKDAESL